MRIQHNIAALNSYRNYTNNTNTVGRNLEKLSSGYKINRAGDDAAGLAISEKMRAQITGLETAQKNAADGVSLVQTAEGALTEVHSMLNRMVELADQSANGTYQDKTDRTQLQKEVDALKSEIDRIADATNFNGINLLDGSLGGGSGTNSVKSEGFDKIGGGLKQHLADVDAVKAKSQFSIGKAATSQQAKDGDVFTLTFSTSDGKTHEFKLTAKVDDKTFQTKLIGDDGEEYFTLAAAAGAPPTATGNWKESDISKAFSAVINNSELGDTFKVTVAASGNLQFEAREAGAQGLTITSIGVEATRKDGKTNLWGTTDADLPKIDLTNTKKGSDATQSIDLSKAKLFDGKNDLDKSIFEINGKKFAFVTKGKLDEDAIKLMKEAGVEHYFETTAIDNTAIKEMVNKIQLATGLKVEQGKNVGGVWTAGNGAATDVSIIIKDGESSKKNGGLALQIGDTSAEYNQLNVSISDTHVASLGLKDVDISKQDSAKAAVDIIKDAINKVSDTRGTLGATQNRLEHTINNLSVTTENMTAAESRIRDVDVAKEMMAYTKNNILVQSAQAMLAQANQTPQGVLQLLQ